MTIEEAKQWIRDAGDTIKFDRCVGVDERDQVDKEVEDLIGLLDRLVKDGLCGSGLYVD